MCLAIPGKIISIYQENALTMCKVDFGGVVRAACLEANPEAKVGDYAVVHAGFVISLLSETEAQETLNLFKEMEQMGIELPDKEADEG
jgi:hydrogenase expression/formation protein HypC